MVFRKFNKFFHIIILIYGLFNLACVDGADLRYIRTNEFIPKLHEKLNAGHYILIKNLAKRVCSDLQVYDNKTSQIDCENNFINLEPQAHKDTFPPEVTLHCKYGLKAVVKIQPIRDPGVWRLVVLTPVKPSIYYLSYRLVSESDTELKSLEMNSPELHTAWTATLNTDGTHSFWRKGPEIGPWNMSGSLEGPRKYNVKFDQNYEFVNESSTVNAHIAWKSFDDYDTCFEIVNHCNGKVNHPIKILGNTSRSLGINAVSLAGLPLGASCAVQLTGKYGTARYPYNTLECNDMSACIDSEIAQNISLHAQPGAAGWDVYVTWAHHREPLSYNVTLFSDTVTRSDLVPGNMTSMMFPSVEEEEGSVYIVAIGTILKERTTWTNGRAIFPEQHGRWGAVSTALGGAWGALVCGAALLTALALLWRRRRHAARRHSYLSQEPEEKPPKDGESDGADLESIVAEDDWELRSERLLLHEVIGEGAFGVVRRGTLAPAGKEVAVKMLKDFPTLEELRSFRSEMELMKSVGPHPHIVSLVGCCSGRRPFIVAEYCGRGDLLSYLRRSWDVMVSKRSTKYYNNNIETTDYRNDLFKYNLYREHSKLVVNKLYDLQGNCETDLTTRDLLSFCRQIAMGMEFLASNRLVHRDLAARNVLVTADRTLKIADFGLSRDVYEENLYKQTGNGKMPMKWMALESLTRRIYTSQSDVWSFGVVMWEVASVGGSPYADVPPARLPRLLRAGYRMPRPASCSKQLYEVMSSCWRAAPRSRPTFAELHARLDELLNCACAHDYLALELDDVSPARPYNYVAMLIRDKLGWSRGDSYTRPVRTALSNHYSSPPASTHKIQSVS